MSYPVIGYRTNNGDSHSFNPFNPHALRRFGIDPGAISPQSLSFHVSGDLYLVPEIARLDHECGGSINFICSDIYRGGKIEFSHIFYRDKTGHHNQPFHWNHELWIRQGDEDFKLFRKRQTVSHNIPKSEWIEIFCIDVNGKIDSKRVNWEE